MLKQKNMHKNKHWALEITQTIHCHSLIYSSSPANVRQQKKLHELRVVRNWNCNNPVSIFSVFHEPKATICFSMKNELTLSTGVRYSATPRAVPFILLITSSIAMLFSGDDANQIGNSTRDQKRNESITCSCWWFDLTFLFRFAKYFV